jgi:hypothetical protein
MAQTRATRSKHPFHKVHATRQEWLLFFKWPISHLIPLHSSCSQMLHDCFKASSEVGLPLSHTAPIPSQATIYADSANACHMKRSILLIPYETFQNSLCISIPLKRSHQSRLKRTKSDQVQDRTCNEITSRTYHLHTFVISCPTGPMITLHVQSTLLYTSSTATPLDHGT